MKSLDFQAYSYLEVTNDHGKNSFDFEVTFNRPPPPIVPTVHPPTIDDDEDSADNQGPIL